MNGLRIWSQISRKARAFLLVFILVAGTILLVSFADKDFKIVKNLEIYYTLFRELNLYYVDETDPEKLVQNSIEGMLEELDPYTTFIPESEADDYRFMTTGNYGGIGAMIRSLEQYAIVTETYENFPAHKAGLQAGDKILQIDGNSVIGKSSSDISSLLKGTPGTTVELLIERFSKENPVRLTVTREKIVIQNVPYYSLLPGKVGYIRLANFTSDAHKEVKQALLDLRDNQGAQSIVLDLRGNPGGLLIEAVDVANLFLPKGLEIVSTKGKIKEWQNVYKTRNQPVDTIIHLAVLVNRGSASASEIVAGAVQDLDRGVIIGQRTFGKGLVQTTRPLSYNTQLKVTTAKYYIPSGRCIQALDYTHRNEDGSVGHVPDSLISEFKTRNGRKVFDGGGIVPDWVMPAETISKISVNLFSNSLIFDYATLFASRKSAIPSSDDFEITDSIFSDFKEFLSDKDFEYKSESEIALEKLVEATRKEKHFDQNQKELEIIADKLAHDKFADLINFREEISMLLAEEISGRYYYQRGKIQSVLRKDPSLLKAKELLQDKTVYTSLLNGSYSQPASLALHNKGKSESN